MKPIHPNQDEEEDEEEEGEGAVVEGNAEEVAEGTDTKEGELAIIPPPNPLISLTNPLGLDMTKPQITTNGGVFQTFQTTRTEFSLMLDEDTGKAVNGNDFLAQHEDFDCEQVGEEEEKKGKKGKKKGGKKKGGKKKGGKKGKKGKKKKK
jgi:hypothetical protein